MASRFDRHPKKTIAVLLLLIVALLEAGLSPVAGRFSQTPLLEGPIEIADTPASAGWVEANVDATSSPPGGPAGSVRLRRIRPDVGSYIYRRVEVPCVLGRDYTLTFSAAGTGATELLVEVFGRQWADVSGRLRAALTPNTTQYGLTFVCNRERPFVALHNPSPNVTATIVYSEISLRQTEPDPFPAVLHGTEVTDERTHHDLVPNTRFVTAPSPPDTFEPVENEINAVGMRGPAPGPKRSPRVLMVGDSFVEADEVAFESTFPQRLNRHFQGSLEVLAHGVSSWAPTTEWSWIHHKGLDLEPDLVCLFVVFNDFLPWDTYRQSDQAYRAQAIYTDGIPTRYMPSDTIRQRRLRESRGFRGLSRVFGPSALAQLSYRAYHRVRGRLLPSLSIQRAILHFGGPPGTWPTRLRTSVDETVHTILQIASYLKPRGVEFRVALVPNGLSWSDEVAFARGNEAWSEALGVTDTVDGFTVSQMGLATYVRSTLARAGVEWVDLQAAFDESKAGRAQRLFYERDGHWNTAGHEVVFEVFRDLFTATESWTGRQVGASVIR